MKQKVIPILRKSNSEYFWRRAKLPINEEKFPP